MALSSFDASLLSTLHLVHVSVREDASATSFNRLRKAGHKLYWMKLRLAWKSEASSRFKDRTSRPFNPFHTHEAGTESGQPFFFQSFRRLIWCREEKAIDSLEVAVKTFGHGDGFDAIDRRSMAVASHPGAMFAVKPFDCHIAVGNDVRQMRRGTFCHASADRATVEDDYRFALTRQRIGSR